jgi:hypothetical protein
MCFHVVHSWHGQNRTLPMTSGCQPSSHAYQIAVVWQQFALHVLNAASCPCIQVVGYVPAYVAKQRGAATHTSTEAST